MKVLKEYSGSHHYIETYEKTNCFCINCGKQSVMEEQSGGDYYCGSQNVCVDCGASFTYQGPNNFRDSTEELILFQLRSGKTLEPTTKKGG